MVTFGRQLHGGGPAVVVDGEGVWIDGITTRTIPWSEIRGFRRAKPLGADVVRLDVPHQRHFSVRRAGFRPGLVINLALLAADRDEVVEALDGFRPERRRGPERSEA